MNYLAQSSTTLNQTLEGLGPLGLEGRSGAESIVIFNKVITATIGVLTMLAFIWFMFMLILGAYGLLTAGGDKAKVAEARSRLTTAIVGLVITISAVFIAELIGLLFGIDILRGAFIIPSLAP